MTKLPELIDEKNQSVDDFAVIEEIQKAYLTDNRPWIVGYSGGKDSTATLQLVWYALLSLSESDRKKPVYVISSDTLVETPQIIQYLSSNITKINEAAKEQNLPISALILTPILNDTFWVNLIGRGYPTPSQRFRWCTDRLKIKTSSRFIQASLSKYGEVVIILGTRISESDSRGQLMKKAEIADSVFSRHTIFSAAYSYSPIRNWTARNVWSYLMDNPSPWGNDNNELAKMYKDAEGECPFVVDDKSPPCGTSRFGCWVCTLVKRDKSIEALIQSGNTWLKPLLEFRDLLASTQDPKVKRFFRRYKRRMGYVSFKSDKSGIIARGPYKFSFRKLLLKKLLLAQNFVKENGPIKDLCLISYDELRKIRNIWMLEEGDWSDSVSQIYKEVIDDDRNWEVDDTNIFNSSDRKILNEICDNLKVPSNLVVKLIDVELRSQGMARRASIHSQIEKIFNEEWRSEKKVTKEYQKSLEEEKRNAVY